MPTPVFFNQVLISINFNQYAKNQALSSFCSRDLVDLKILQSDWPKAFWSISQQPDFSQIYDLREIQQIVSTLIIDQIQEKSMSRFFNKFKKPYSGRIFVAKAFSSKNPNVTHNFMWVSNTRPKFRKNLGSNSKIRLDGRTDPISYAPSGYNPGVH